MYKIAKPLLLKCETPLHAGSGSDLNFVDLPIQRERHTTFPKIEGSSLKGGLREHFNGHNYLQALFGTDSSEEHNRQAGALAISDARLLLFPVRSVHGLFAWITCPEVLQRAANDFQLCGLDDIAQLFNIDDTGVVAPNSDLIVSDEKVILEEYAFKVKTSEQVHKIGAYLSEQLFSEQHDYWKTKLKNSLVVLQDIEFRDFVNISTEVITRTKINSETGTVEQGALFTEEYLPVESVLYSIIFAADEYLNDEENEQSPSKEAKKEKRQGKKNATAIFSEFQSYLEAKENKVMQLGGSATIGKGILSTKIVNPDSYE